MMRALRQTRRILAQIARWGKTSGNLTVETVTEAASPSLTNKVSGRSDVDRADAHGM
ncbi:MAG: hypothetical protein ACRD8U_12895 [Pyrinomonadaceae bacterium]